MRIGTKADSKTYIFAMVNTSRFVTTERKSSRRTAFASPIRVSIRGVTRGGKGAQFPGCWIVMGASKTPNNVTSILSSIQYICFLKTSNSNMGAPNLLLAPGDISPRYAPGINLLVPPFVTRECHPYTWASRPAAMYCHLLSVRTGLGFQREKTCC